MISPLAALVRLHELNVDPPKSKATRQRQEERLLQALSSRLRAHYDHARARYGDSALVPLERNVCRGCYMRQPSVLNEIEEGISQCENCGRLNYDADLAFEELVG